MAKVKLELGSYVIYKSEVFIAVAYCNSKQRLSIMNPSKGINRKLSIKVSSLTTVLPIKCDVVDHNGQTYLVTTKNIIISKQTLRVMKWGACDPIRRGILTAVAVNYGDMNIEAA